MTPVRPSLVQVIDAVGAGRCLEVAGLTPVLDTDWEWTAAIKHRVTALACREFLARYAGPAALGEATVVDVGATTHEVRGRFLARLAERWTPFLTHDDADAAARAADAAPLSRLLYARIPVDVRALAESLHP